MGRQEHMHQGKNGVRAKVFPVSAQTQEPFTAMTKGFFFRPYWLCVCKRQWRHMGQRWGRNNRRVEKRRGKSVSAIPITPAQDQWCCVLPKETWLQEGWNFFFFLLADVCHVLAWVRLSKRRLTLDGKITWIQQRSPMSALAFSLIDYIFQTVVIVML